MKFRLTYEGALFGSSTDSPRAKHKQEIRKALHPQLKRLWEVEPNLKAWAAQEQPTPAKPITKLVPAWELLAQSYARNGYNFVPVATATSSLHVALEVLFLRPDVPGGAIKSGDIDNRLKTLFDALKMPTSKEELGGYATPSDDEKPFFVLLEDDRLISHVAVETDVLLQPTPTAQGNFLPNDARLVITVMIRPYAVHLDNLHFA